MKPILRASIFGLVLMIGQAFGGELLYPIFKHIDVSIPMRLILGQLIILIIPTIVYLVITRQPVRKTLRLNPIGIPDMILIIFIGVLIYPMGAFIGAVANLFFPNVISQVVNVISGIPLSAKVGIMALTPAICEEITMRGIFLSGYRKVDIKIGALMSGLVFGMLHMNFQQFFYAFALGVLLSYLVHITDSIFASMICHFTFNSTSILLSLLVEKLAKFQSASPQDVSSVGMTEKLIAIGVFGVIALIFAVIAGLLMWALIAINKERNIMRNAKLNQQVESLNNISVENIPVSIIEEQPVKDRVLNWAFITSIFIFAVAIVKDAYLG